MPAASGIDPLYGPIARETNTASTNPDSDGAPLPHSPAEPAARHNEDDKAFIRRMVEFANESRENRELYWRKDGQRKSLDDRIDGRELPQLKRDPDYPDDEDRFIAASDVPPPVQPDYMPADTHPPIDLGRDEGRITPENLADLDAETNDREWTLQADRISEAAKLKAKEDHGEDSEEYKEAKRVYSDTHSAVRDIGESHGEHAALYHAMATQHPEYVLVDVPRTGNGDQTGLEPVEPPHSGGAAYLLGHWLTEPVVLEGHTGRILLASAAGPELLGSSLPQFMTLVGLYRMLILSDFPSRSGEGRDARRSVKAWAAEVDPEATASFSWQGALDGHLDDL
ncbi:hypothetical protein [Streptomyces sp. NPDC093984]|uniref:hypothetical protein n=1 Tax=Streptomyces sp. NPDC093984 TaxID=3366052 RepID=UPI0037F61874